MANQDFELHERLVADTSVVGDFPLCRVLLAKEDIGPWLILVPRRADLREIHHMSASDRAQFFEESVELSKVLESTFEPQKLNVAALGNMVPQLHVHHVVRFDTDAAWPKPIWGNTSGTRRSPEAQAALVQQLATVLAPAGLRSAKDS